MTLPTIKSCGRAVLVLAVTIATTLGTVGAAGPAGAVSTVGTVGTVGTPATTSTATGGAFVATAARTEVVDARPAATVAGALESVRPARIADSRAHLQIAGPVASGHIVTVQVAGRGGVPLPTVSAGIMTVTAVDPSASGYLTVWPAGTTRPNTSTVNFRAGKDIASTVIVPVSDRGAIDVFNGSPGAVQILVDVSGYALAGTPTARGALMPLVPARIADSRSGVQISAIPGRSTVTVQVAGAGDIPADAAAAVLTVTAISPQAGGFITVWPAGTGRPATSSLNFQPGQSIPDTVIVPIDSAAAGRISMYNGSPGTVQLAVDVTGYILAGTPTATGALASVPPTRIADSRSAQQIPRSVSPSGTVPVQVTGNARVPDGASAAVLTVTAVDPVAAGYLAVWPAGQPRPDTSAVNFQRGQSITNLVIVPLGSPAGAAASIGKINIFNGSPGATQVLVDVSGYLLGGVDTDTTGPDAVSAPTISGSGPSGITLTWTPATAPDVSGVMIRRATSGSAPRSITDGALVADVLTPQTRFTDEGLAPATTYSYALFAHDGSGNTAIGAGVTGTTLSPPLWAWGSGTSGELGNGTTSSSAVPTPISGLANAVAVAGGVANGFALGADGAVWSWGDGSDGRLGNGGLTSSAVPVRVSGLTTARAVAGGSDGYAMLADGTVRAWGDGSLGALGNGGTASSPVPVRVSGLTHVVGIAAAGYTGYAVTSDGTAWAWGAGGAGRLGNGSRTSSSVPVRVTGLTDITAVAGGFAGGYALRRDGTVWAWGDGSLGALGNGGTAGSTVPVQVKGLTKVTAIAAGLSTALALRDDGTVWAWGDGSLGALGTGGTGGSVVPVQVSGLTAVRSVAAGYGTGYAVRSDGTGWAWGDGSAGQLTAAGKLSSTVPVRITGLRTITTIAAGSTTAYAMGR